jgi:FixJ family two-component response regulator
MAAPSHVDDDASVRESLELLMESAGWTSAMFASAVAVMRPRFEKAHRDHDAIPMTGCA